MRKHLLPEFSLYNTQYRQTGHKLVGYKLNSNFCSALSQTFIDFILT